MWSGGRAPARERGPEMTAETTDYATAAVDFLEANPGLLRRDAMNEGWDPSAYILDSEVVNAFAETVDWDEDAVDAIADVVLDALGL